MEERKYYHYTFTTYKRQFILNDNPEYIMKCIKGTSSHRLFEFFSNTNRFVYRKLWGRSYNCREISKSGLNTIVNYIGKQMDKMGVDKRFKAGYKTKSRHLASGYGICD